ncbi:MAG: hypothetical protein LQ342_007848 [Letrouitia transgressa]|nr:MAG: hypothetical protein LQ342_007848 [Letrouitia transgressa]
MRDPRSDPDNQLSSLINDLHDATNALSSYKSDCVDLKLFRILVSQNGFPISAEELGKRSSADTEFIVRIMRVITALNYAAEAGERSYIATPLTNAITLPALEACVVHSSEHAAAVSIAMPTYFARHGYKSPTDRMNGPFQHALHTSLSYFDYLHSDERKMRNFNNFMTGSRGARKHWTEWFPVRDIVLQDLTNSNINTKLLVDMGGGKGHDLARFLRKFPEAAGRLVLQDLPGTVATMEDLGGGIDIQSHNLFTAQPVRGAKAYYTHFLLHDFPDPQARAILEHGRDAMTPGYSRLLLNESILPEKNCPAFFAAADITMMAVLAGMKRSKTQWVSLVESAGLKVIKIWESPEAGDFEGVIEATRPLS